MRDVAIVGVGITKFGERWEHGLKELMAEAGLMALQDAKMESKEIEMVYGGTMAPGKFIGQEHVAALLADQLGLQNTPAVRIENASKVGENGKEDNTGNWNVIGGREELCNYGTVQGVLGCRFQSRAIQGSKHVVELHRTL